MAAGCQSAAAPAPVTSDTGVSATVDLADGHVREVLTVVLGRAVHRAHVELGPTTLPRTSTVVVLPPHLAPRDTYAMVMPTAFYIVRRDGKCLAIRADTKQVYDLPGVECTPVGG
jgi:hypothetical protein